MGVQHQYDGLVVDTPDGRRIAVVRGTLSGATFVQEYDKQGKEISSSELHGGLGALISKAAETYPPSELPHLIDATIRMQKVDKARFAFDLAKALTETMLGKNNGVGNEGTGSIAFENAAQLSQMELDVTKFSHFRPEYVRSVVDVLNYTWDKIAKIQQAAGVPWGKPRFRVI